MKPKQIKQKQDIIVDINKIYDIIRSIKSFHSLYKTDMGDVVLFLVEQLTEKTILTYLDCTLFIGKVYDMIITTNRYDNNLKKLLFAISNDLYSELDKKFNEQQ